MLLGSASSAWCVAAQPTSPPPSSPPRTGPHAPWLPPRAPAPHRPSLQLGPHPNTALGPSRFSTSPPSGQSAYRLCTDALLLQRPAHRRSHVVLAAGAISSRLAASLCPRSFRLLCVCSNACKKSGALPLSVLVHSWCGIVCAMCILPMTVPMLPCRPCPCYGACP